MIFVGRYLGIVMEDGEYFQENLPHGQVGRKTPLQHDMLLQGIPHLQHLSIMPNAAFSMRHMTALTGHGIDLPYNPVARGTEDLVSFIEDSAIGLTYTQILVFQYALVAIITMTATLNPTDPPRYRIIVQGASGARNSGYAHTFKELLWVYKNLPSGNVYFPHTSLTSK